MISVAALSQKGGVGKTTVSLNLSYALARRGHRVLLVDVDPQGAIGFSLAGRASSSPGLVGWMEDGGTLEDYVLQTRLPEFSILPLGEPPADRLEEWVTSMSDGTQLERVLAWAQGRFDVVFCDTPAGGSGPSSGVLASVDYVLVPLQAEPLALRTFPSTLRAVNAAKARGNRVQLAAVVLTMTTLRNEVSSAVAQEVWSSLPGDLVLETHVPRDTVFAEASAAGVPVGLLRRRPPPVAAVFDHIAAELEPRIGLVEEGSEDGPIHLLD
ncbi:MAG: ParA family protein [Sandaracinaceae bacterium]